MTHALSCLRRRDARCGLPRFRRSLRPSPNGPKPLRSRKDGDDTNLVLKNHIQVIPSVRGKDYAIAEKGTFPEYGRGGIHIAGVRLTLRIVLSLFLVFALVPQAYASDGCMIVHGRVSLSGADLQLRLWRVGTHHEYEPDDSSWNRVIGWLNAGVSKSDKEAYAIPASSVFLFADFKLCPTEGFKDGQVQRAHVVSMKHPRYLPIE